jgi:hypothetical protein
MTNESDTLAGAGTETVETFEGDSPSEYDFYDPDEDQDTVEADTEEGTDDEEGEPEGEPEEEPDAEPKEEPEETPKEAAKDAVVKLPDGTETTVDELTKGYFRQADYTRKSQDLAQRREAVTQEATRVEQITEKLVDHLTAFIPDAPDPSLAYSDPGRYTALKAQHDTAVQQMQAILSMQEDAKTVNQGMTDRERHEKVSAEGQKLFSMFPEAGSAEGRQAFFSSVGEAAQAVGFSREEVQGAMDHRIYALAHWAQKGMEADKAKASAKAKLAKAAPTPQKKPGQGAKPKNSNRDAMKRLNRTGSIKDALAVDFDF